MVKKTGLFLLLLFVFIGVKAQDSLKKELNVFIDNWHKAAAVADEDTFFGSMTENCIYIGTDKTERWKRDELKKWSEKYFQRESAWSFKPYDRDLHILNDIVWFSELLDTWMGVCRGSGILRKTKEGWKLEQYHLSVTIDNDKIESFLKLDPN